MPAYPGLPKKSVKFIFEVDVIITRQGGTPKAFTKTTGTQKDRHLPIFKLGYVTGLVHIIIAVIDNLLKAADGIRDFFYDDP